MDKKTLFGLVLIFIGCVRACFSQEDKEDTKTKYDKAVMMFELKQYDKAPGTSHYDLGINRWEDIRNGKR